MRLQYFPYSELVARVAERDEDIVVVDLDDIFLFDNGLAHAMGSNIKR